MKLTIPLYQEKFREDGQDVYYVRPLFVDDVHASRPELRRATDSLRNKLRKLLQAKSGEPRHDALALLTQCPELAEHRVDVSIRLKRRTLELRFLFAVYEVAGKRVAFTPRLPELMFELKRSEDLKARADEVLTAYFRRQERESEPLTAESHAIRGTAWLGYLNINLSIDAVHVPPRKQERAEIGSFESMRGAEELAKVGRNLNALYPDELSRAVRRDELVDELLKHLKHQDKRPVLLLGRPGVGKTAIIEETVRRIEDARKETSSGRRQLWLISPQRLISGMSFVGQWENRVHAILDECKRKGHILCFDDVVGLFRAGISASSKVSVAQVLKPHIEKHEVRILAEMTPESFRVLQEMDRGFADLFHIMQVDEPTVEQNARILVHLQRELEARTKARFALDALPTAIDLMQRYQREIAMPGKVAGFLNQLAVKNRKRVVNRHGVLREFEARSGMKVMFLDEHTRLQREWIQHSLKQRIVGQEAGVDAMTDVVSISKARLNDPERPLGSLLFLGPTGVGKTECAKALAAYLYGDESRMLRFDMNEFIDASSVARLVGTIGEPEGLLTSAVRRQPFSTILLDEIEKAHPAAFDVLLQVLGEGRLTDALGRTADFTNCVIIMTSNLGVREAESGLGVAGHESRGDDAYVQAARRFFRPEFFNRIDRIVPFRKLERKEIEQIAGHLLHDVFAREGLTRRRCVLQVDALAMERVVDQGFHPTLGARAIKREVERRLTRPLSARLAELNPQVPTIIHLMARGDDIAVGLIPLEGAEPAGDSVLGFVWRDVDETVGRIDSLLNRAEEVLEQIAPDGAVSGAEVTPELRRYFAIREQVEYLDDAVERFLDWQERQQNRATNIEEESASRLSEDRPRHSQLGEAVPVKANAWLEMRSPNELHAFLARNAEEPGEDFGTSRVRRLAASGALLNLMLEHEPRDNERVLLGARTVNGRHHHFPHVLLTSLTAMMNHRFDLGTEDLEIEEDGAVYAVVSGYLAEPLCSAVAGLHLHCSDAGLDPIQVIAERIPDDANPLEVAESLNRRRRDWAESVAKGEASPDDDPLPPGKVVQVHFLPDHTLDVRSRMVTRERPSLGMLATWLLTSLPLPEAQP